MGETADSFILKNLKELTSCRRHLISEVGDQIGFLCEDLQLLRNFLGDLKEKFHGDEEVENLEARIRAVECKAESTIKSFLANSDPEDPYVVMVERIMKGEEEEFPMIEEIGHDCSFNLDHVKQAIVPIKREVMEIYNEKVYGKDATEAGSIGNPSIPITPAWEEETMVGFEEEVMIIKEQLTGAPKQLEVLSIVGMAGLGKTTLARKVYNDPLVLYHFYIRAWISVSQEYRKRDLLHRLLSSVMQHSNGIDQMSEEELPQLLYRQLKGRRYFIVLDDVWDSRAWLDLKNCFPNDKNGSRILFTSRHGDAVLHAKPSTTPFSLRFRTHDESWVLLRQKIFRRNTCPPELEEIGKQIAKKCQGLPLAIVVVAGILVNEKKRLDQWEQVAETLHSRMGSDPQQWYKPIELSYNHLPRHLKQCFLYFGTLPEDFPVPVWKLIWLWVAMGFIQKTKEKSLEDVAEEYLMDLIGRSLILVSRRRLDGGVKACGIHDLLRDFCFNQAKKEHFLWQISSGPVPSSHSKHPCISDSLINAWTATSIVASAQNTETFSCFNSRCTGSRPPDPSVVDSAQNTETFSCFNSRCSGSRPPDLQLPRCEPLRALDLSCLLQFRHKIDIEKLGYLRYLALGPWVFPETGLTASLSYLQKLETLVFHSSYDIMLPQYIKKMVNLRHLLLTGPGNLRIDAQYLPAFNSFSLDELQTLSWIDPRFCRDILVGTPNLRKLGFRGEIVNERGCLTFPDTHFLGRLEELKLFNTSHRRQSIRLREARFPKSIKKLTLSRTFLNWDEVSTLGKLVPTLEVLKLLSDACVGLVWQTSGDFPQLKCLKFEQLDIVQWNASIDHFPMLQRLTLVRCYQLKEIPSEVGYIPTLQMIEVRFCSHYLAHSAWQIKEEQKTMGNNSLQVVTPAICRTADIEVGQRPDWDVFSDQTDWPDSNMPFPLDPELE